MSSVPPEVRKRILWAKTPFKVTEVDKAKADAKRDECIASTVTSNAGRVEDKDKVCSHLCTRITLLADNFCLCGVASSCRCRRRRCRPAGKSDHINDVRARSALCVIILAALPGGVRVRGDQGALQGPHCSQPRGRRGRVKQAHDTSRDAMEDEQCVDACAPLS